MLFRICAVLCNFYPRPPRGGRPPACISSHSGQQISIHALREEGDSSSSTRTSPKVHFYPRPPRGGRPERTRRAVYATGFLSTPSARRATPRSSEALRSISHFYPRPPRGGRRLPLRHQDRARGISIHALREEGDLLFRALPSSDRGFLSTPSARRATDGGVLRGVDEVISIHALREEGDHVGSKYNQSPVVFLSTPSARRATHCRGRRGFGCKYFYPRPPRGGRRVEGEWVDRSKEFLSTPSARRATHHGSIPLRDRRISIHALREEGDPKGGSYLYDKQNFYPRPPRGGRQQKQRQNLYFQTNYTTFCTNLEEP